MAREYETVVILHPDTLEDGVQRFNHRVKELLEGRGGKLLRVENWGKRKLAYEIEKETKGIYTYYLHLGSTESVTELERNLRIMDISIRYQTVKLADDVDAAQRAADESAEIDFLAAADEAVKAAAEAALRQEVEDEAASEEETFEASGDDEDVDDVDDEDDDSDDSADESEAKERV